MRTCQYIRTVTPGSRQMAHRCTRRATARVWIRHMPGFDAHEYDYCTYHANNSDKRIEAIRPIRREDEDGEVGRDVQA
jgi:hypothetical protein